MVAELIEESEAILKLLEQNEAVIKKAVGEKKYKELIKNYQELNTKLSYLF